MDRDTAVATCEHGHKPEQCQLCAAWESAIYNQHRAERAEEEVARWKAEAMAAREMIGIALDVDGYPYPFKRSVSFDCGQKYLDIRAANEAREAAREGESDASSAE